LDRTGLVTDILDAVGRITRGRLYLRTEGKAEQGRIDFHDGLKLAHELYTQAFNSLVL
jgi:hypothetical protein